MVGGMLYDDVRTVERAVFIGRIINGAQTRKGHLIIVKHSVEVWEADEIRLMGVPAW